jgi:hypothetical protein
LPSAPANQAPRAGPDLGDELDRPGRLVLLELGTTGGQVADDSLDIVDLEVRHGLATLG